MSYENIHKTDIEVNAILQSEAKRQMTELELIPSENYTSLAVQEALGSCMTNKYSEGYPGKRYYGGQTFTDKIETLAIKRACKLFNCKFANVQPLSGSPANMAVYFALLQPGDTILSMDLQHGGHLTHGHPTSSVSKIFNFIHYKMKDIMTGEIDYEEIYKLAKQYKPKIILLGFSAYPRNLDYAAFAQIAKDTGAITVADMAHIAGLIAGKALPNPFDYGIDIITTTTHKTLRGPRGGMILVKEDETLIKKINTAVFPGIQGGPHMNNIAAKAIAFKEASTPHFKKYCQQTLLNAKAMEKVFSENTVIMLTGGTSNHLILIDTIQSFDLSGKQAEEALDAIGIIVNKNVIANDTRGPLDPSGIRVGTPAITSRGFTEKECELLADIIVNALVARGVTSDTTHVFFKKLANIVSTLAKQHPIPESY